MIVVIFKEDIAICMRDLGVSARFGLNAFWCLLRWKLWFMLSAECFLDSTSDVYFARRFYLFGAVENGFLQFEDLATFPRHGHAPALTFSDVLI